MKISSVLLNKEQLNKIDGGAWVMVRVLGNDDEAHEVPMKLRGSESIEYQRVRTELLLERDYDEKDPMAAFRLDGLCIARALILDWGMLDDDGCVIPYTRELGEELLTDRGGARFQNAIRNASMRISRDGRATMEELAKN